MTIGKHETDEIRFLIDNIKPLLETYEKEYEEHEMPLTYPTPDTYYITIRKIEKLLSQHRKE